VKASGVAEYWEDRLAKQFELEGVGFLGLGRQYNAWLYRVRSCVFRQAVKTYQTDLHHASVLDVGAGTGFYVDKWKALGVRSLVGIDLTQTSVERLRYKFPEYEFWQADIGGSVNPLPDRSFDVISAFDVLFHILDDDNYERALDNIHKLLKPGGLFVFSENFLHRDKKESAHQVSRRLDTILRCLTDTGFAIVARSPMLYLMNAPIDSDSRLLHVFWRAVRAIVSRSEVAGLVLGGLLFPTELILVQCARESPTTEIMVCRKVSDSHTISPSGMVVG
jgi:SAM-dependent methyltransferase